MVVAYSGIHLKKHKLKLINKKKLLLKKIRCVKMHTFCFTHKAPTFTSWGFVIT